LVLVFRFISGTKPSWIISLLFSAACISGILLIQFFFSFLLIYNRYNLIYGLLSNLIVLLLEVFSFFIIFLISAQMIYIIQFFDSLFIAELYLLPERTDSNPVQTVERILFMSKKNGFLNAQNFRSVKKGSIVFNEGDDGSDVFYILSGTITISTKNYTEFLGSGAFFGEISSFLHQKRNFTARAHTDSSILSLSQELFADLILTHPEAAQKLISLVSSSSSHIYGRKD